MTTPEERHRHRIWAREALAELAQDAQVPRRWRQQAADLLARWPPGDLLTSDGTGPVGTERGDGVDVLLGAQTLLQRVRASATCTKERRYSLYVILRHLM